MTNGNDEKVRQLTEDVAPDAADLLYLVKAGGGDRKVQVGNLPGGGASFVPVTVPLTHASWDEANATGTWKFPDSSVSPSPAGTVKQTDVASGHSDLSIFTNADFLGSAWAFQADITLDAPNDDTSQEFGIFSIYPAVASSGTSAGFGLYVPFSSGNGTPSVVVASANSGMDKTFAHAIGDTHTYKLSQFAADGALIEIDGNLFGVVMASGDDQAYDASRLALYAYGAVTFANIKIAAIPVPTFA